MPPAIELTDLTHRYGRVEALRGVTLTVAAGEFFGLFGPNGAGKSTLIRILATLITPTRGTARVNTFDVHHAAARVRASIGLVVSNENSFYGRLTGRQNLEFFAALQKLTAAQARGRATDLLAFFELTRAADAPVQTYSTGMRQKLNVARALLHDPPIIFLDEPTKGMDPLAAEALRARLRADLVTKQGKTILLTTHDLQEMEQLCDRVGILERGQLRQVGAPRELIRAASATVVYRLELAHPAPRLREQLEGLPGLHSVIVISPLLLDLTLTDSPAPGPEVWTALAAAGAQVKRLLPKDDGLLTVLRQANTE